MIAEPSSEALARFQKIVDQIMAPAPLIPMLQKEVRHFDEGEPLANVLTYMGVNEFSQGVVRLESKLAVLSTEAIAGWLESRVPEDLISLADVRVGDALGHEPPGSFVLLRRDQTIWDALEVFSRPPTKQHPRIVAALITQHGRPDENALGIVTPWDLPVHVERLLETVA